MSIQTTAHWLRKAECRMHVAYVFEHGHKFRAEADALLTAIGQQEQARQHFYYRSHLFERKEAEFGLQAADLFAWTVTKAEIADGKVAPAFRPFVVPILKWAHQNRDKAHLHQFTNEKLDRFFEEAKRTPVSVYANRGQRRPAFS